VPDGAALIAFTEAVVRPEPALDDPTEPEPGELTGLRATLIDDLGPEAAGHAAATVSAFSGLVRVADATGIPIDDGLAAVSVDTRADLGLDGYGGAANSRLVRVASDAFSTVDDLFDNRSGRR
jgi:hypothetical protein